MIPFTKAHANGNDFLILDESLANRRHAALAQHLCARTTGIGADGIEFIDRRHRSGELFLRLFNADGSEAELSGNGTRCVVVFTDADDFSAHGLPWQQLGARIATDPRFPHGTNVEFVQLLDHTTITFRIFERGCGPTTSSGTGTCAAAAAAMALRDIARSLTVLAEGGPQYVTWPTASAEMQLTGPAELLCTGQAFDPAAHLRATSEDIGL